jgi:hypothetical protein
MVKERNKGQAGQGGRGKNMDRNRQDVATRTRGRNLQGKNEKGGATLTRPSSNARKNQGRNQEQWHEMKRQRTRY